MSKKTTPKKVEASNGKAAPSQNDKAYVEFFNQYKEDEERIGPEGVEKLCNDLQLPLDHILVLVLAWKLGAKESGTFTKEEFVEGTKKLGASDVATLKTKLTSVLQEANTSEPNFKSLYRFAFDFSRENTTSKIVNKEIIVGLMNLLVAKRPHTKDFIQFLNESPNIKSLNTDQWLSFLHFSKVVKPDLSNYGEIDALPSIYDDYVEFAKNKKTAAS